MPAVMLPAKKNRNAAVMRSSLGRRKEEQEFTVEQVEAVIATLNDKVTNLQKDIGALRQTDASHRRMQTNLTYARNVDDKRSRLDETKVAKGKRRESKSFSRDGADSPESLSCRAATSNAPTTKTTTTTTTTTQQEQQRKHALFNGQRKNRPQPQEVNSQADERQNTLYPNASDFALSAAAATPPPRRGSSSGSKAPRTQRELGARSIDNEEQEDRGAIPRNMDGRQVSWRGIDSSNEQQQRGGGLADAQRCRVDERSRAPVVKPVATPHRRASLNEAKHMPKDQPTLDRGSGKLATAASKATDQPFIGHADQDETTKKHTTLTRKTTKGKVNDQQIADANAPKLRSIIKDDQTKHSKSLNDKSKLFKFNRKDTISKEDTIKDSNKSSKMINLSNIAKKSNNTSDKNQSATTMSKEALKKETGHSSKNSFLQKKQSAPPKNDKNHSKLQTIKNNSKSNDSIEPKNSSIKNKLSKCTKELNQLIAKVSDLFRKKSSKSN